MGGGGGVWRMGRGRAGGWALHNKAYRDFQDQKGPLLKRKVLSSVNWPELWKSGWKAAGRAGGVGGGEGTLAARSSCPLWGGGGDLVRSVGCCRNQRTVPGRSPQPSEHTNGLGGRGGGAHQGGAGGTVHQQLGWRGWARRYGSCVSHAFLSTEGNWLLPPPPPSWRTVCVC